VSVFPVFCLAPLANLFAELAKELLPAAIRDLESLPRLRVEVPPGACRAPAVARRLQDLPVGLSAAGASPAAAFLATTSFG
jgi:hypothetical protein